MDLQKLSKKALGILFAVVLLIGLIPSFYFYRQYKTEKEKAESGNRAPKDEIRSLIKKVSNHIVLPKDEEPTIATVSDKEKLKNQPFFARAENGDKVLIFTGAKKAILYRPASDKIIDVVPVNLGTQSASVESSRGQTAQESVKVAIYNGTKIAGLANTTETDLRAKLSSITVVEKGNANNDYTKSLIVDLTGNNKKTAEEIVKITGGELTSRLPEGEKRPNADVVVIVGK